MAAYGICSLGALAGTFCQYFVLQTALSLCYTIAFCVLLEVNLTFGYGVLCLFFLFFLEILVQQGLGVSTTDGRLLARHHITDALCEIFDAEILNVHTLELLANAKAQSVANFVHY